MTVPPCPARPVRPARCTYFEASRGGRTWSTRAISSKSTPRDTRSVASSTSNSRLAKAVRTKSRSFSEDSLCTALALPVSAGWDNSTLASDVPSVKMMHRAPGNRPILESSRCIKIRIRELSSTRPPLAGGTLQRMCSTSCTAAAPRSPPRFTRSTTSSCPKCLRMSAMTSGDIEAENNTCCSEGLPTAARTRSVRPRNS
mmetsp:Transcript_167923/g.539368  ORF Transcript_167923/g.539368 Transcript_167923/m.539368 type:complete len:200 (-) Transcript_167923:911-1510(-)